MSTSNIITPKDGVQAIIHVGYNSNFLFQQYLLITDKDDRGTGTGILKTGLAGGGIEIGESPPSAIIRELKEEVDIDATIQDLSFKGSFNKYRDNGATMNNNHLFLLKLVEKPKKLKTNDSKEVSRVHIKTFNEIVRLSRNNAFHEGSIRLILLYLKGVTKYCLNNEVRFRNFKF